MLHFNYMRTYFFQNFFCTCLLLYCVYLPDDDLVEVETCVGIYMTSGWLVD